MKIDIGDVTWNSLSNPHTHSGCENILRFLYYKWVYPFADRANETRIGHLEAIVEEDGEFKIQFIPRFKMPHDDVSLLKAKGYLDDPFPPDVEEMDVMAKQYETKWKKDHDKQESKMANMPSAMKSE